MSTSSTTPPDASTIQQNTTAIPTPLQQTRIGTVLISAAVIDDVVGLVLASLIPALSTLNSTSSSPSNLAWIIARPLVSSSLTALLTPLVARFVLHPMFRFRGVGEQWCAPGAHWGSTLVHGVGQWGTEQHADAAKLLFMVLCVSVFAVIASCEWHMRCTTREVWLTIFIFRYGQ